MHDHIELFIGKRRLELRLFYAIGLDKMEFGCGGKIQAFLFRRIQRIEVIDADDRVTSVQQVFYEMASDEPGGTGNQHSFTNRGMQRENYALDLRTLFFIAQPSVFF